MNQLLVYQDWIDALQNVLGQDSSLFVNNGLTMTEAIMGIVVVWFGVNSFKRLGYLPMAEIVKLFTVLTIAHTMIAFYVIPIPGIGYSFIGLFTQWASYLAHQISLSSIDTVFSNLGILKGKFEVPSWTNVSACIELAIVMLLIDAIGAVSFLVIMVGFVMQAILILLGPIFIPFFLFPGLEFAFWGWFKSFWQYSFYRVFAAAAIKIMALALAPEVARLPAIITVGDLVSWDLILVAAFGACIFVVIWIPSMVSNTFSGGSGGGLGGWIVSVAGKG